MSKEIILYHGTTESKLPYILRDGIQPSNATGKPNYKAWTPGCSSWVYLTDTWPLHYSINGVSSQVDAGLPVVIKISIKTKHLYPDEDFLGEVLFLQKCLTERQSGTPMEMVTEFIKLEDNIAEARRRLYRFKWMWENSLQLQGCVACKYVDPNTILDYVMIADEAKLTPFRDISPCSKEKGLRGIELRTLTEKLFEVML